MREGHVNSHSDSTPYRKWKLYLPLLEELPTSMGAERSRAEMPAGSGTDIAAWKAGMVVYFEVIENIGARVRAALT
jgi:hypothetical protein